MPSFTQRIANLEQVGPVLELDLAPSVPYMQALNLNPQSIKAVRVMAMIDTGATTTVICKGLATQLGINPIGQTFINTPSSTNVKCLQFDIQILFPNNVNLQSVIVTEAPLQDQHIQCLIGRDILKHSVLVYTGYDNSFTLSF